MQSPEQQADGNNFWSPTYTPFKLIIQEWKPPQILEQFPGPAIALQAITECYISITSPSKRDKRESNKSKKQWHLQGCAETKECFMTSALKRVIKIVCLLHVFQQKSPALFKIYSVYLDILQNAVLPWHPITCLHIHEIKLMQLLCLRGLANHCKHQEGICLLPTASSVRLGRCIINHVIVPVGHPIPVTTGDRPMDKWPHLSPKLPLGWLWSNLSLPAWS